MKHQSNIRSLLNTLVSSENFHCLIVQSPPGWAKSTTINDALEQLKINAIPIGTYSTPLHFYNSMAQHPNKFIVLDDCSGLFDDLAAMAVLKAATWPNTKTGERFIQWASNSAQVMRPEGFAFTGKLILLTNIFPNGRDTDAFKSRSLFYQIHFTRQNIAKLLKEAAKSKIHYQSRTRAEMVAKHLIKSMEKRDFTKYNLRTLKMAYEFAANDAKGWRELLGEVLPSITPEELVKSLATTGETVANQAREFQRMTGKTSRYFYKLRASQELGDPIRAEIRRAAAYAAQAQRAQYTQRG